MGSGFHIENFGCRAARADGEAVAGLLRAEGMAASAVCEADVVVVNTCSVTAEADREARAYIRRAHRQNPDARIVVTGCYAQRAPEELAGLPGVAAVVGNSHKAFAAEIAAGLAGREQSIVPVASLHSASGVPVWADDEFAHSFLESAQVMPGLQTRPNLKIQEGCGNRCTFCVIPQTRGRSRSLPAAQVLAQVRGFVNASGNELVISGINLGRWGRDLAEEKLTLAGLVRKILDETNLPRLRLSSIEPMDWDAELIRLFGEFGAARLARHAHLPLQSGSDAVLRRMHRRYRPWHYEEKIAQLVGAAGDELAVGADVMVGFPGETDAEFEETARMIERLPFAYLHLFPFSPRPGTRGWELHRLYPVAPQVVRERMAQLKALAETKTRAFRGRFVGRMLDAITLHTSDEIERRGATAALTGNFLPVEICGESVAANRLVRVVVQGLTASGELSAELAHP